MRTSLTIATAFLMLAGASAALSQGAPKRGAQPSALPEWQAQPRYATLNLRADFQPDPREVQVEAGGDRQADPIGPDCGGWIDYSRPDVDLNYEPGQYPLYISAVSDVDTTIVVNDPSGAWHCNDDLEGLNPGIVFQRPLRGNYNIWVGTLEQGRPQRAVVRVSEVPPGQSSGTTVPAQPAPPRSRGDSGGASPDAGAPQGNLK